MDGWTDGQIDGCGRLDEHMDGGVFFWAIQDK